MGQPQQFHLLDSHSMLHRALYAKFQPLSVLCPECGGADPVEYDLATGQGPCEFCLGTGQEPTKVPFLMSQWIMKLCRERAPAYLALAGDGPRTELKRRELYPEYKANRSETPKEIEPQIRRVNQIMAALGICNIRVKGYEADDVLATIATQCVSDEVNVVIWTRDNDLEQLCADPRIRLYDPMTDEYTGLEDVRRKRKAEPWELSEIKALTGEDSDNIPGVPGIGPVTATKLIRRYKSAAETVRCRDELSPKLADELAKMKDQVLINRQLVELVKNVPLPITSDDLVFKGLNLDKARPIFRLLGFKRWSGE